MKRVINGKVYDTDKAKLIATADNMSKMHGNGYIGEASKPELQSFYRKKTGEFFLYAPNGSFAAQYIFQHDYDRLASGGIFPFTYDQAKAWAERELPADKWEEVFGDPEDDDSTVQTVITMPAVKLAKIKQEAAKEGMSVSAYIVHRCVE